MSQVNSLEMWPTDKCNTFVSFLENLFALGFLWCRGEKLYVDVIE